MLGNGDFKGYFYDPNSTEYLVPIREKLFLRRKRHAVDELLTGTRSAGTTLKIFHLETGLRVFSEPFLSHKNSEAAEPADFEVHFSASTPARFGPSEAELRDFSGSRNYLLKSEQAEDRSTIFCDKKMPKVRPILKYLFKLLKKVKKLSEVRLWRLRHRRERSVFFLFFLFFFVFFKRTESFFKSKFWLRTRRLEAKS